MMRRLTMIMLKIFLVVAVALAVLQWAAEQARAATPDPAVDAWVQCGSTVQWAIRPGSTYVVPTGAEQVIAAAWEQVAAVAGLTVQQTAADQAGVRWLWIDRGVGDTTPPGDSISTAILGDPFRQHAYPGGQPLTPQDALTDVLGDLGVAAPTSADGVLSDADAAAIARGCEAQAAAAAAAEAAEAAEREDAAAAPDTTETPDTAGESGASGPNDTDPRGDTRGLVAKIAAGLVGFGLLVWFLPDRVRAPLTRQAHRLASRIPRRTKADLPESEDTQ